MTRQNKRTPILPILKYYIIPNNLATINMVCKSIAIHMAAINMKYGYY
jgi:hypothetical protein